MAPRTGQQHQHVTSLQVYLSVGAALVILTALTVKVSMIHLGGWNAVVALTIAATKGLLVALFFMHLIYDKKIYMIIMATALVTLAVFIILTMFDTLRRGDIYTIEQNPIHPEAKIYQQAPADTANTGNQTGE
jgi:cytochrome c oxidase subunit 4